MSEELCWSDPQNTFAGIEFYIVLVEPIEYLLEVHKMIFFLLTFDDNVINVYFNGDTDQVLKNLINQPLICGLYIFQSEGYDVVTL